MTVEWIAAYVMFGAFVLEGIASKLVLRDGHYDVRDTAVNVATMIGYVGARIVIGAAVGVILLATWKLTPLRWSMDAWWHWGVLFLLEDFLYYWSHRASHVYRVLWASHVTHHSSPVLNMSTGLRNSWVGGAIDWVFFVPMAALGFHPLHIAAVIAVASAWDFLTHTPYIGKLPGIDWLLNSPANHRVHHAKDAQYVDKNFGGATMIWDRLFGTYEPERAKPSFGIDAMPARPHNPIYLQFHLWADLVRGKAHERRDRDDQRVLERAG